MKLKAVVLMVYDRSFTGGGWKGLTKTITRVVKDIEFVEEGEGLPMKFSNHEFKPGWEADQTWKRYRGKIKYGGMDQAVEAWTFGDHAPLYWSGVTARAGMIDFVAHANSLWNWISLLDFVEDDEAADGHSIVLRAYHQQPAYQQIRKHLGADAFERPFVDDRAEAEILANIAQGRS